MKTLVIGLGNPLLGDDGVGWHVARLVERRLLTDPAAHNFASTVEVDFSSGGGLALMERLADYDAALLIDAVTLYQGPVGTIYHLRLEDLPNPNVGHISSVHDASLLTALELGRTMGIALPYRVDLIGIEANPVFEFGEQLSPAVAAAVPQAAHMAQELIKEMMNSHPAELQTQEG